MAVHSQPRTRLSPHPGARCHQCQDQGHTVSVLGVETGTGTCSQLKLETTWFCGTGQWPHRAGPRYLLAGTRVWWGRVGESAVVWARMRRGFL